MQDIQDRLGVAYAVEGSLRAESGGIVINVSLFETSHGRQIWTRQLSTPAADIGRTTTEIATEIARELNPDSNLSLLNPEISGDAISAKAYEAYLRGLDFLARPPTPETLDAASLFFSSALKMEPEFERASAALCETYLAYYRMARTDEIQTYYDNAVRLCQAAIELNATHWAGHQSLATLYRLSGRFEDALREIRLADTLHPETASVHYEYGKILAELGEPEGAEDKLRRGIALDPGFWGGYADLGDHLYLMGRYEEALTQFQKAAQLSPDNDLMSVSLGATYYMLDRPQDAHASWKRAIRDNPDSESRAFWQSATWLGINSLNMSCPEEAAYWQQQAISVSGSDHRLWGRLAESCQMQQTDYSTPDETARQIYERAIELAEEELAANPNDWESLGLLAVYRARTGAGNDSQRLIDRMLEMQPDNPDALEIALHFAVQQDNERASETLQLRLRGFNYPPSLLERNPYIGGLKQCATEADEKEHLICAQGRIIPALRN
jgi:tetratricopeptide (TPR) repeat protein